MTSRIILISYEVWKLTTRIFSLLTRWAVILFHNTAVQGQLELDPDDHLSE